MHEAPLEQQIETTFFMFDVDNTGYLSRSEFASMIEATVALNLGRMLLTEEGTTVIEVSEPSVRARLTT